MNIWGCEHTVADSNPPPPRPPQLTRLPEPLAHQLQGAQLQWSEKCKHIGKNVALQQKQTCAERERRRK